MSLASILTRVPKALACCGVLFIMACNPAVYKKPAENFQASAVNLKQAYFLELDISNKSSIEHADLGDQIAIWGAPAGADIKSVSKEMTKRRQTDIHETIKPLREQAFAALEGYAAVLVDLSSDEPTEAIASELNGLIKDINGVLKKAEEIKSLADKAGKAAAYTGPLQKYVDVLNELLRTASGIIRERAIIQTINKSNDSVVELMSVLRTEAATARGNIQREVQGARSELDSFIDNAKFASANNAIRVMVAQRTAELNAIERQLEKNNIDDAFDAAAKTQEMLLKKAHSTEPTDWTAQIQAFNRRVAAVKDALEKVRSEM